MIWDTWIGRYAENLTGTKVSDMFYETPNLDKLMSTGISFSQAYACPLCAPTQATLLTGKYASPLGFTTAVPPRDTWYNQGITPPENSYVHDVIYHGDDISIPQAWINATTNTAIPLGYENDGGRRETISTDLMTDYNQRLTLSVKCEDCLTNPNNDKRNSSIKTQPVILSIFNVKKQK